MNNGIPTMHNPDNAIWIMLRGLAREHRHWEGFPTYFREHMNDPTLVLPDLPGCGIHYWVNSPRRVRDIVEFVRADIAVHLFDRPVYILGLSLGAMVALEWAWRYPRECAGAVLMNTSIRGLNPFYQRLRPGSYRQLLRALRLGQGTEKERIIFRLTSNLNRDDDIVSNWVRYASELPVSRRTVLRQILAAGHYTLPATRPDVPLLLLRGMGDRLVDPVCSLRLAEQLHQPLQTHPAAGHDLTLDAPEWVCSAIGEWMTEKVDGDESMLGAV